jgi:hypothetical protein
MGAASRRKGARGEVEACRFFELLGLSARRVGILESGRWGKTAGHDIELGPLPWRVQVKNVQANCPALPVLMKDSHIAYVHYTRGRTYVVVDADDLAEFCRAVVAAAAEGAR